MGWKAKLRPDDIPAIRELRSQGLTQRQIATRFGVTQTTISAALCAKTWLRPRPDPPPALVVEDETSGTPTPTDTSPFELLQEDLRDDPAAGRQNDPWRLLATCLLLNRARALDVAVVAGRTIGPRGLWPDAAAMAAADASPGGELASELHLLGLQNRRAARLVAFSQAWLDLLARVGADRPAGRSPMASLVAELPGVGAYALDSYRFFVRPGRIRPDDPVSGDERLAAYASWARTQVREDARREAEAHVRSVWSSRRAKVSP